MRNKCFHFFLAVLKPGYKPRASCSLHSGRREGRGEALQTQSRILRIVLASAHTWPGSRAAYLPCWANADGSFFTSRTREGSAGNLSPHLSAMLPDNPRCSSPSSWTHSGFWNSVGRTWPGVDCPRFTSLHGTHPLCPPISTTCSAPGHVALLL